MALANHKGRWLIDPIIKKIQAIIEFCKEQIESCKKDIEHDMSIHRSDEVNNGKGQIEAYESILELIDKQNRDKCGCGSSAYLENGRIHYPHDHPRW